MAMWKPALTVVCCLFAMASSQDTPSTPPSCNSCNASVVPSSVPRGDVYSYRYIPAVANIWNQINTTTISSTKFKAFLQAYVEFNDGTTPRGRTRTATGVYTSLFINNFLPYMDQQPDACFMAAVINASVYCPANNRTPINNAITQLQNAYFNDIIPRTMRTMIINSGCDARCGEYPPDLKVNKTVCHENGLVCAFREVWGAEFASANLPLGFRDLLFQMYASNDYNERFFAVCATFVAMINYNFEFRNEHIVAEVLDLIFAPPVQPSCCLQRMARVEEIRRKYEEATLTHVNYLRWYWDYNTYKLCPRRA